MVWLNFPPLWGQDYSQYVGIVVGPFSEIFHKRKTKVLCQYESVNIEITVRILDKGDIIIIGDRIKTDADILVPILI